MKCISMLVVLVGIVNVAELLFFFALSSCDNGQGGRKQIFYGGARLKRKKNFLPEFGKLCNFY